MRRALVLSSGGAKSSWQVGACQHLINEGGLWFDVISGVSAGAINGAALAHAHDHEDLRAHLERLSSVWLAFRGNQDIYRRRRLAALGLSLGMWNSLCDTAPLRELLAREIDPPKVAGSPIRLRVGYVDLRTGRYRTAGNDHPHLLDAVLASSSLPLIFPPTPVGGGGELGVDGAMRHATPLTDAVCALSDLPPDGDPPEVWVILLHPPGRVPATDTLRKWFGIAFRSLSFDTDEVLAQHPRRGSAIDASPAPGPLCERYPRVRVRVLHPPASSRGRCSTSAPPRSAPGTRTGWRPPGGRSPWSFQRGWSVAPRSEWDAAAASSPSASDRGGRPGSSRRVPAEAGAPPPRHSAPKRTPGGFSAILKRIGSLKSVRWGSASSSTQRTRASDVAGPRGAL